MPPADSPPVPTNQLCGNFIQRPVAAKYFYLYFIAPLEQLQFICLGLWSFILGFWSDTAGYWYSSLYRDAEALLIAIAMPPCACSTHATSTRAPLVCFPLHYHLDAAWCDGYGCSPLVKTINSAQEAGCGA